ncbi:hypothetical protein SUVC_05G1660 [Saccharomyces uvarum]|uniref:Uncharacterized protein n=1 Tax=Saccharomyces uvarum TaxID=230603 RepID=A0AA35NPN0_SACUV|nr:hypothetical protein SUVC_05G1660 [Saccharomyces uvarum]
MYPCPYRSLFCSCSCSFVPANPHGGVTPKIYPSCIIRAAIWHLYSFLLPLAPEDQCSNQALTSPPWAHLQTPASGSDHPPCGHHSSRCPPPFRLPATPPFLLLLQMSKLRPQCQRNGHSPLRETRQIITLISNTNYAYIVK